MDNNDQPDALLYEEGSLIADRYYIQRSFSSGGQGEIYLCLDMKDQVPLILKTPRPDSEGVGRKLEDLETEVLNWIELGVHPNVVECRYVDIIDSRPFIVLEPVINEDGIARTLSDCICEHGTLELRQALDFSIDICRGLLYVKTSNPNLVHQDLKPQNVLIGVEDIAKITDFGPGVSLPYMAPEQFTDPNIRHKQADIYAFGCILYEMLNGAPPFGFGTEKQGVRYFRRQHAEADIPSLSQYPDALNLLIHKCLAKNVQDRFQDLSILLSELITLYGQQFGVEPHPLKTSRQNMALMYCNYGLTFLRLGDFKAKENMEAQVYYDKALAYYDMAIQADETYAKAFNNRGALLLNLYPERKAESLDNFNQAIKLDPHYAGAICNRGHAYSDLGQLGNALGDYHRAAELDPRMAAAYHGLANVYLRKRQLDLAIENFSKAIDLAPELVYPRFGRALAFRLNKQLNQALQDLNQVIAIDPSIARAYVRRADIHLEKYRFSLALRDYGQFLELVDEHDPDYARVKEIIEDAAKQ